MKSRFNKYRSLSLDNKIKSIKRSVVYIIAFPVAYYFLMSFLFEKYEWGSGEPLNWSLAIAVFIIVVLLDIFEKLNILKEENK
ncbi:MAG: hypothetical protein HWE16_11900 [Gammaproteobacteria bacterium]|nr:hypothetical protein [Gammaproteobacteria bacterium]